jgi:hypothetical protein
MFCKIFINEVLGNEKRILAHDENHSKILKKMNNRDIKVQNNIFVVINIILYLIFFIYFVSY